MKILEEGKVINEYNDADIEQRCPFCQCLFQYTWKEIMAGLHFVQYQQTTTYPTIVCPWCRERIPVAGNICVKNLPIDWSSYEEDKNNNTIWEIR